MLPFNNFFHLVLKVDCFADREIGTCEDTKESYFYNKNTNKCEVRRYFNFNYWSKTSFEFNLLIESIQC
jgi:hypothetical protein